VGHMSGMLIRCNKNLCFFAKIAGLAKSDNYSLGLYALCFYKHYCRLLDFKQSASVRGQMHSLCLAA
jgi:hypothetical protein